MARDYPEQSYYPSCKIRLTIRLDEFGDPTRLKPVPTKPAKNLNGIKDDRAPLVVMADPASPSGVHRFVIVPAGEAPVPIAQRQARSDDGLTFDVTVIPKDMDWNVNGIRTADTLNATFKYIDCPIHPQTTRAIAVEAFLGTITDVEYQRGIAGAKRSGFGVDGEGESLRVVQDTYLDSNGVQRSNSRFLGWVDKWEMSWSDTEEPMIRIECRDNTQLLIDQQAPVNLSVDANLNLLGSKKPLDEAIALYLSHFPQFQGLSVEYRPYTDAPPVLSRDILQDTAFRPKLGPQTSNGGASKLSVWDYLTDVCGSLGHTIRVEGTLIVIQTARSLSTDTDKDGYARRSDDPFQGRTLNTGVRIDYRRFIYGRNLKEMKFARHFARNKPTNIEVRCWNSDKKELLVERFPLQGDRQKYALPGNAQTDTKWEIKYVKGIRDRAVLRQIAQTWYEQLGRNELTVEMKTHNLASFGGGNLDPDILDLHAGDTIEILAARRDSDEINTLNRIENILQSQQKGEDFMKTLGFSDDFAKAYSKAYTDAGFLTLFRLRSMKVHWTIEQGVELTIQAVNYIEIRADKQLATGEEPGTKTSQDHPNAPAPKPINDQVADNNPSGVQGPPSPSASVTNPKTGEKDVFYGSQTDPYANLRKWQTTKGPFSGGD